MAAINSIREFHSQLADVCSALEALFNLASREHEDLCIAAMPAMFQFRELLDQGDAMAGDKVRAGVH